MTYSIEQISSTQSVIAAITFVLLIGCTILHRIEEREEHDLQVSCQLFLEGAIELARNHKQREQEVLNNIRLRQAAEEDTRNRIFLRSHIHAIFACVQNRQQPCGCRYSTQGRARDLDIKLFHECYPAKLSGFFSNHNSDTASTGSGSGRSTTSFTSGTVTPATPVTPMIATLLALPENRYDSSLSFLHDYFADELN
ncbi:hypothetical protein PspLS_11094 [Pyricularia sp. CBS 133598]|nr:hypothetical protein PspLS_11094 [Pyricularia sp. CBS 133598]